MAKGTRNDARKSGKAPKQNPGRRSKTSKLEPLTEVQKILMGKGLYPKWSRVIDGKAKGI